ncbi:MAG: thrombospondin type 3 repeat-containing protein [Maribacter sp.]|nr:thrombospondin type 3 repeat-containing protein [Maribacter sp.]
MKKQLFIYTILLLTVPLLYLGCEKDDDPLQFSFTVTITPVTGGTVNPSSGIYNDGKEILINAIPAEGYGFIKWSGDATGDANPLVLTISSNTRIIAEFAMMDSDGDGVGDTLDQCPNTPEGEMVDTSGCGLSEVDSDGDGITDDLDLCHDTPANEEVDEEGCADSQKDTDGDGVTDDLDLCADTPPDTEVDEDGCADFERDTDGDGLTDDLDRCPESPAGSAIDAFGCPVGSLYTYIPDDVFEQILIIQGYDYVLDDYVLTNAINTLTELSLFGFSDSTGNGFINDFTGIEAFVALEQLSIFNGDFMGDALDLSQNSNLIELSIFCSFVDDLDLSQTNIEVLSIGGNLFFGPCESRMENLDLSGVTTLKTLNTFYAEFDDLNATLNSATSLEQVNITGPQTDSGPLDYLDLSANKELTSVSIAIWYTPDISIINLKNGANQQLTELILGTGPLIYYPPNIDWEPCIEVDDPTYIKSIIETSYAELQYTVTTDCGN